MDVSEDEAKNHLSEENWMKLNNWKFIKYVIHHTHPMTPEQLKQKPFEEIFKNQHEKVDTQEGESIEEEEKSTTSSDKSEQDSESDITTEDEEETHIPETLQIHNENITEIETFEHYGEKIHETEESISVETSQVLTVSNKAIHHEDDSSDDISVIEIEPPKHNGEYQ